MVKLSSERPGLVLGSRHDKRTIYAEIVFVIEMNEVVVRWCEGAKAAAFRGFSGGDPDVDIVHMHSRTLVLLPLTSLGV